MTTPTSLTGRRYLELLRDGEVPAAPIQIVLGFDLVAVGDGSAVFSCTPTADLLNPMGTVHGGVAMTLLDSAAGAAVHTTLGPDESYATLETKVNMLRAVTPDGGEVVATGTVVHRGGRVALAEASLVRASDGKLLAHATSTCLLSSR